MRKFMLALSALVVAGPTLAWAAEDWHEQIASGLGKSGTEMPDGVYRISLPRSDLKVMLDGVEIKPSLALGSWLAFRKAGDGVLVMGDIVLTDQEVNPVMRRLAEGGVDVTAIHNHLLRASPNTMYMHVHGHGEPARLAATLRNALEASKTPLSSDATASTPPATSADQSIELDTAALDQALGRRGKVNGGVYQVSIPRAEPIRDDGMDVPDAMGSASAINFQPTGGGRAAMTGDLVLTADEVNPVLKALREHEIEVTALHNHMLGDEPRLFFMHFWANDDAGKLATGIRAALDKVKVAKS